MKWRAGPKFLHDFAPRMQRTIVNCHNKKAWTTPTPIFAAEKVFIFANECVCEPTAAPYSQSFFVRSTFDFAQKPSRDRAIVAKLRCARNVVLFLGLFEKKGKWRFSWIKDEKVGATDSTVFDMQKKWAQIGDFYGLHFCDRNSENSSLKNAL